MDIFKELDEKVFEGSLIDLDTLNKLKFITRDDFYKSFKSKKTCIFPNCKNKSIKRSHTIPRSGSLKIISDNSHLLYPHLCETGDELSMKMERIGIGEASVFPGFCVVHEKIFAEFEQKKDIDSIEQAKLQAYRSICREIVINNLELEKVKKAIVKYKNERNRQYKLGMESKIGKKVDKVKIEYSDIRLNFTNIAKVKITEKLEFLSKIHDKFVGSIKNEENEENDENIFMNVIHTDMKIPIALSGLGYANIIDEENNRQEIKSILNVIPFESSTVLIFAGDNVDKEILDEHFDYIIQHPFLILNFIESFMMHGTDHWFIQPEVWNKMDGEKQKYILEYFFVTEKSFLQDVNFSIFDDIRKDYLVKFPLQEGFKESEENKFNFNFKNPQKSFMDSLSERYNYFYETNGI
ncbi:hypothetical protein [Lysinibacillus xylanilyticus]|uniref:Uncharacterized protein n=1 Tax=Lysinibacillus xylanilyticus TaxID=582475 RepID=A0A2M9Q5N7_9BACI|nr:hypothetical protein [Lysinibacillus xylanilyticus]PJO43374.1 hypothetical protein CWD94_12530 [Lysinibacillus xylanilyticus]